VIFSEQLPREQIVFVAVTTEAASMGAVKVRIRRGVGVFDRIPGAGERAEVRAGSADEGARVDGDGQCLWPRTERAGV